MMQGLDIFSAEADMDCSAIPADFIIVKSTQGLTYVNPAYERQCDGTLAGGKRLGIYHYIGGQGVDGEMENFVREFSKYGDRAIPFLDWESIQNSAWRDESYLDRCIAKFIEMTGKVPGIYASLSVFPWGLCRKYGCLTWVAQYANDKHTGYQDNPWNEGAYACDIRQYSSTGRIGNWNSDLDINKCYFDAYRWDAIAGAAPNVTPDPTPIPTPTPAPEGWFANWVGRLQTECNRQEFSDQSVDHIPGPVTLDGCPTCRIGASGGITALIQEFLVEHGYSVGDFGIDGKFGKDTKKAVEQWQRDHGLSDDGVVGPKTWASFLGL